MKQHIFLATLLLFASCEQNQVMEKEQDGNQLKKSDLRRQAVSEIETTKDLMPVTVALAFINSYVDNMNSGKESKGIKEWMDSGTLTSTHFKKEMNRLIEESEDGLDVDPILDAQDYPEKGFELDTFDNRTNYMVVKGKNWPDFKLTLKMIREDEVWLVDGCGVVNVPLEKRSAR